MNDRLPGQLPLFTLGGSRWKLEDCDVEVQAEYADEVCDECGGLCTSSKECVEISGLYDYNDADPA